MSTSGAETRTPVASSTPLPRRLALASLAVLATVGQVATAAPTGAAPAGDLRLPLKSRYEATQHGSVTRIGNTLLTCDEKQRALTDGSVCTPSNNHEGANNAYSMAYVNARPGTYLLDDEQVTVYSSSSATLSLPAGSKVSYARLYWGGARTVGGTAIPVDWVDGVLFRAPKDKGYREIDADGPVGHLTTDGVGGYQASADVTRIVRAAGSGEYVVANMDAVVESRSWGGWTLVVAYQNAKEPYRHLHLYDGYENLTPGGKALSLTEKGFKVPVRGTVRGGLGVVAYDGDRDLRGDSVGVRSGKGREVALSDGANPADNVFNSTIGGPEGADRFARAPRFANQLGYDSDRLDMTRALRRGDTSLTATFRTKNDGYAIGAVYTWVNVEKPQPRKAVKPPVKPKPKAKPKPPPAKKAVKAPVKKAPAKKAPAKKAPVKKAPVKKAPAKKAPAAKAPAKKG